MSKAKSTPKVVYHFTSPLWLLSILISKFIALTESNLNTPDGNCGVVWLTSSPDSNNHGLKFDKSLPVEYVKTRIRITLPHKATFKHWDKWSDMKGMDKGYKEALICTASAEETYKTWYISEKPIPITDFMKVENIVTGEIINIEEAIKNLPETELPKIGFQNVVDQYIANQPENLQVMLLNIRLAIRETLPDAEEKISWDMPTYWKGKNLIHFAAQKNHLGIYPGAEAMKHFMARLVDYKTSKGAIQFPYKSFNAEQLELIKEIAAWCGAEIEKI